MNENSPDSLTLSWKVKGGNFSSYLIRWGYVKGEFVGEVDTDLPYWSYTIIDLEACTRYYIVIIPEGAGEIATISGKTARVRKYYT